MYLERLGLNQYQRKKKWTWNLEFIKQNEKKSLWFLDSSVTFIKRLARKFLIICQCQKKNKKSYLQNFIAVWYSKGIWHTIKHPKLRWQILNEILNSLNFIHAKHHKMNCINTILKDKGCLLALRMQIAKRTSPSSFQEDTLCEAAPHHMAALNAYFLIRIIKRRTKCVVIFPT